MNEPAPPPGPSPAHAEAGMAVAAQSPLFAALSHESLTQVVARGSLQTFAAGEVLFNAGEPAECLMLILAGEVAVLVPAATEAESEAEPIPWTELIRLYPPDCVGEMGFLLHQARTATVRATQLTQVLRFDNPVFEALFDEVPGLGLAVARLLARRLARSSGQLPMRTLDDNTVVEPEVIRLLPVNFISRHRVLPISQSGPTLLLGCVEDANRRVLSAVRQMLPGLELQVQRITSRLFDRVMAGIGGVAGWAEGGQDPAEPPAGKAPPRPPDAAVTVGHRRIDELLNRMVAEGCSDLHLSGGQRPRWRIDGEMQEIADAAVLGPHEAAELLRPAMPERARTAYAAEHDVDFAYELPGVARFRVNMFLDQGGAGAVLRLIPSRVLSLEQLNLPPVCQALCERPKGLVLVTGPTGSGKSTTLAAMIDWINRHRRRHIITLEEPIEFVHPSRNCLINQREVGPHTKSFARALKAALREDPDIVMVGEMRDLETIALALETANTGHLVFGTLHTATAANTVDRIIDVFPAGQQSQVRAMLADSLKGVMAQTLCRRVGGGRVAALETMVVSVAIANLIREGKVHQIASAMVTAKAEGNLLLNESLAALVLAGTVTYEEARSKAIDKADLARRCQKAPESLPRPAKG